MLNIGVDDIYIVVQVATKEGEKLAVAWNQECSIGSRRENQRDAERLSSEERSLVRHRVAGRIVTAEILLQLTERS